MRSWLSLALVESLVPVAAQRGVSEVARSDDGFVGQYRRAKGSPSAMKDLWYSDTQNWWTRRNNFVKRHMAQVESRGEPLWDSDGAPSRRHLALTMWAYSPDEGRLRRWLRSQRTENPFPDESYPRSFSELYAEGISLVTPPDYYMRHFAAMPKSRLRNPCKPRVENPTSYIEKRARQIAASEGALNDSERLQEIEDRLEYLWGQAKEIAAQRQREGMVDFDDIGGIWAYTTQVFKASQPKAWRDTEA